jgi:hypothetical protein
MAEAKVIEDRIASGDVGPCSHQACKNRALHIITITVKGLETTVYACAEHKL